jgi:hypothetical protein
MNQDDNITELAAKLKPIIEEIVKTTLTTRINEIAKATRNDDHALLSSRKILKILDLKPDHKDWRSIREILIADYGMTSVNNSGLRIPHFMLKKFLNDQYVKPTLS